MALVEQLPLEIDQLSLLSEALEFRLRREGTGRAVDRRGAGSILGDADDSRSGAEASGKTNPTVREFMHCQPPRPAGRRHRRRAEGGRRSAGGAVRRARVRRLRGRRHARAGRLRGLRRATSSPSCSGAACITPTTRARRCATTRPAAPRGRRLWTARRSGRARARRSARNRSAATGAWCQVASSTSMPSRRRSCSRRCSISPG